MANVNTSVNIDMQNNDSRWDGVIKGTITHDPANEKVTVNVTMTIYETYTGTPREGAYRCYLQISKDGTRLTYSGSDSVAQHFWLTDLSTGGYKISCQTSFSYSKSCKLTINGWSICDSGVLAVTAVQGSQTWTLEANKPATQIQTDKDTVQMGKKLLITLNRAYSEYTHTLYYKFGTGTEQKLATGVASSYTWEVPDLANLCNNATSGSCTLRAITYNGSESSKNKIGETSKTIQITVQDPTTPTVSDGEVTLGTQETVACKRNSQYFTQKIQLQFYGQTFDIWEGSGDSAEWTPTYDIAKLIPNLTYGTGTLQCITKNGTAEVGTKSSTIRVNVPENDKTRPTFALANLELSPVSDLGEEYSGLYIRGKTGMTGQMEATSKYSTIAKYELTVGSLKREGNPAVIDMLVNDGNVKVTAKVTDARGYSRSVSTTVYIYPYRSPKVIPYAGYNDVICERADGETGALTGNGTYLAIRAGKSFSSIVVNGQDKNSCVLKYRWKMNSSPSFTDWITLLDADSKNDTISVLIGNVVSSLSSSYMVEIAAVDALGGEHRLSFPIMTEAISFVLYDGPDGAGFGKYPEEPHTVDIASHMTLLVRGKLVVSSADWVDIGLAENVRESAYSYGRKEFSSCYYLVSNGNHIYVAFNCGLTFAGTAMVINAEPIPEEFRPPQTVFSMCPMNDRSIGLVSVNPDGYVRLEWIQKLTDTTDTGNVEVIWMDGYLDYWT